MLPATGAAHELITLQPEQHTAAPIGAVVQAEPIGRPCIPRFDVSPASRGEVDPLIEFEPATEIPRAFIREQFRKLLGREPNPYELSAFATEWESDAAVGPKAIIRAIVGSREYQSQ